MATVLMTAEQRTRYEREAAHKIVTQLREAFVHVQATKGKPRLAEHARAAWSETRQLVACYLNTLQVRYVEPGAQIWVCDIIDVENLLPVLMVWRFGYYNTWNAPASEHNAKDLVGSPQRYTVPEAAPETLVWLLGYVLGKRSDGACLNKLTAEAAARVQRTCWTDEDVKEQRKRMGMDG